MPDVSSFNSLSGSGLTNGIRAREDCHDRYEDRPDEALVVSLTDAPHPATASRLKARSTEQ